MQGKPELVANSLQVAENVRRFNEGLSQGTGLEKRLAYARAWYYIPEEDAVGPSKFIGYQNMTAERYLKGGLDGKETEGCLPRWFRELEEGSPEYLHVRQKVVILLDGFGKKLNRLARFYVPC